MVRQPNSKGPGLTARAWRMLRANGPLAAWQAVVRVATTGKIGSGRRRLRLPVSLEHLEAPDQTSPPTALRAIEPGRGLKFGWVVPPVGVGSGGHLNIFRFVRFLESRGHDCQVFIYDPNRTQPQSVTERVMRENFPAMRAPIRRDLAGLDHCSAIFATSWDTAYPVRSASGAVRKFYFVQDFEPSFYPVGTESVLAANTYSFGFHGITAGRWLADKLSGEFGMRCDHFEFGSDLSDYVHVNHGPRRKVLFYARPVTPRRGFELGVLALDRFHRSRPDFEINMAGWPLHEWDLPFPFVDLATLPLDQLNGLYNECAAALVVSLTNFSLLPLELLSAGCIPVVNDGPNNRMVSDNPFIVYARPTPAALAEGLVQVVDRGDLPEHAARASASVQSLDWDRAGESVEKAVLAALAERS